MQSIIKEFPNALEDSVGFAKEVNLITQTCQPGYSDLYQLIHMLVGEGHAGKALTLISPHEGAPLFLFYYLFKLIIHLFFNLHTS